MEFLPKREGDSLVQKFNEVDDRDEFALFINAKRKEANHYLFNATRLIAPILDKENGTVDIGGFHIKSFFNLFPRERL